MAKAITRVYRYFPTEEYAADFVRGQVWLTTFAECRGYEDRHRGDPSEGTQQHGFGLIAGHGHDPAFRVQAATRGIEVGSQARDVTIENIHTIDVLPNAWLLCASLEDKPDAMREFGAFCVKIVQPFQFAERVAECLSRQVGLKEAKTGPVHYRSVVFGETERPAGHAEFVKNTSYEWQKEYRMMFRSVNAREVYPRVFECPDARTYLRRIR